MPLGAANDIELENFYMLKSDLSRSDGRGTIGANTLVQVMGRGEEGMHIEIFERVNGIRVYKGSAIISAGDFTFDNFWTIAFQNDKDGYFFTHPDPARKGRKDYLKIPGYLTPAKAADPVCENPLDAITKPPEEPQDKIFKAAEEQREKSRPAAEVPESVPEENPSRTNRDLDPRKPADRIIMLQKRNKILTQLNADIAYLEKLKIIDRAKVDRMTIPNRANAHRAAYNKIVWYMENGFPILDANGEPTKKTEKWSDERIQRLLLTLTTKAEMRNALFEKEIVIQSDRPGGEPTIKYDTVNSFVMVSTAFPRLDPQTRKPVLDANGSPIVDNYWVPHQDITPRGQGKRVAGDSIEKYFTPAYALVAARSIENRAKPGSKSYYSARGAQLDTAIGSKSKTFMQNAPVARVVMKDQQYSAWNLGDNNLTLLLSPETNPQLMDGFALRVIAKVIADDAAGLIETKGPWDLVSHYWSPAARGSTKNATVDNGEIVNGEYVNGPPFDDGNGSETTPIGPGELRMRSFAENPGGSSWFSVRNERTARVSYEKK